MTEVKEITLKIVVGPAGPVSSQLEFMIRQSGPNILRTELVSARWKEATPGEKEQLELKETKP